MRFGIGVNVVQHEAAGRIASNDESPDEEFNRAIRLLLNSELDVRRVSHRVRYP